MKPYVIGAIALWFIFGIVGAWLLGEQKVDVGSIAGGPLTFFNGLNKPVDH